MTFNGSVSGSSPYIVQVLQGANELSDGAFGLTILIIIWSIVYFANRNTPAVESFASACWITMLVAIMLGLLGIVQPFYIGVCITLTIVSTVMIMVK